MVLVVSRFRVANGLEATVADAFLARPGLVDTATGFLGLEVFTDAGQPEVFYLLTRWTDEGSYRAWHSSADHRLSHLGIPKGLRLDPAYTRVVVGSRIEPHSGVDMRHVVSDSGALVAAFLSGSVTALFALVAADGTIEACNDAFAQRLGREPAGVIGTPLSHYLTTHDADLIGRRVRDPRTRTKELLLLNVVGPTGLPVTLRCWLDVHGDRTVILGEPEQEHPASVDEQLLQMANEMAVLARENARQKRELEASHWHLEKISELLPICMECGKVKTGSAKWDDVRTFLRERSRFLSHGYCPECAALLMKEWEDEQ